MEGLLPSFLPILKRLNRFKKYKAELLLLGIALGITVISAILYAGNNITAGEDMSEEYEEEGDYAPPAPRLYIDLSGAIEKPGVYEVSSGARLKDIVVLAGGLSANAHRDYFSRNFNLAKILSDQEKIYVPSENEIINGLFIENQKVLDTAVSMGSTPQSNYQTLINVNSDSADDLDKLPGVGPVTAGKIIQNRPYKNIEELVGKKVLNKKVFENIKELITIN